MDGLCSTRPTAEDSSEPITNNARVIRRLIEKSDRRCAMRRCPLGSRMVVGRRAAGDEDMTSIHMTMLGEPYGDQVDQRGCPKREGGPKLIRFESPRWRPKSSSSPSRPTGLVCLKLVTQNASGLRFLRSTYGWKANLIRKATQVVSRQNLFRINRNRRNKSVSRIYHGAATPSFRPLDRVSCLGPLGGASRGGDAQDSINTSRRSP